MRPVAALLIALALAPAARGVDTAPTEEQRRDRVLQLLWPDHDERVTHAQSADRARVALRDLDALLDRHPREAELHFLAGHAWIAVGDERGAERAPTELVRRAIGELELARSYAPDGGRAEEIADELGILYSKLGDPRRAVAEYDRELALRAAIHLGAGPDPADAPILANSAEGFMGLGRLDEAIARYRRAADLAGKAGFDQTRTLALYGLAVALDRDGQLQAAHDAIAEALSRDPRMRALDDEDVFFMPKGDKLYYKALGYEAQQNTAAAALSFRGFLEALPASPFAARAREHLAELQRMAKLPPGPGFHVQVGEIHSEGRDGTALRARLQKSERDLRACFDREDFIQPSDVDLVLTVKKSGKVVELTSLIGDAHVEPPGMACLEAVVRRWPLGAGEEGTVTVPLHLEAGGP